MIVPVYAPGASPAGFAETLSAAGVAPFGGLIESHWPPAAVDAVTLKLAGAPLEEDLRRIETVIDGKGYYVDAFEPGHVTVGRTLLARTASSRLTVPMTLVAYVATGSA